MEKLSDLGLQRVVTEEILLEAAESLDGHAEILNAPQEAQQASQPSPSNPIMAARSARILSELNDLAIAGSFAFCSWVS